ncbi:hypothetical protein NMY22_g5112 [Coprinellus aureogranulatus]|nr:hypothetical protein NMY22_g5112 [Coprinellus aureogranulatus]
MVPDMKAVKEHALIVRRLEEEHVTVVRGHAKSVQEIEEKHLTIVKDLKGELGLWRRELTSLPGARYEVRSPWAQSLQSHSDSSTLYASALDSQVFDPPSDVKAQGRDSCTQYSGR